MFDKLGLRDSLYFFISEFLIHPQYKALIPAIPTPTIAAFISLYNKAIPNPAPKGAKPVPFWKLFISLMVRLCPLLLFLNVSFYYV